MQLGGNPISRQKRNGHKWKMLGRLCNHTSGNREVCKTPEPVPCTSRLQMWRTRARTFNSLQQNGQQAKSEWGDVSEQGPRHLQCRLLIFCPEMDGDAETFISFCAIDVCPFSTASLKHSAVKQPLPQCYSAVLTQIPTSKVTLHRRLTLTGYFSA